jgi:hypothetical protein
MKIKVQGKDTEAGTKTSEVNGHGYYVDGKSYKVNDGCIGVYRKYRYTEGRASRNKIVRRLRSWRFVK